jgi:hypothetical protein
LCYRLDEIVPVTSTDNKFSFLLSVHIDSRGFLVKGHQVKSGQGVKLMRELHLVPRAK